MKIAVISDIHANIYALINILENIDDEKVDTIICLGDLVGYGPHPNEVISMIRRRHILCIKGNYDSSVVDNKYSYIRETPINAFSLPWTVNELREENRIFLENSPLKLTLNIEGKNILFVHGSPNAINEYLLEDGDNTNEIMNTITEDVLVCAHTHIPGIKEFGDKLYVNCGSIGKPKIGRPNSTYCILDITKESGIKAQIKEVPYAYKRTVKDVTMLNFPNELIHSFETGVE
ncbi:metallophosphoesterase family protein [Clostridium saccharoperbutylacetonicum]|jgi:putative phosphoesterase|uniref:Phosphoesterase n=1 Tax=Clostridium saccharoperbutylacetonicum N1-4(HMT) TaxID=931276 RepID=M1LMA1_9CLOT|nr:metallophosphoesterase family protein [Clostridium saccharoperbutylacetonicum]AGF53935.1 metallophosphoesterase [Clostridium saccharoperbutylacetonicum N1-4(HMT)]AQR92839.1 phosphodiesterase YfcE [Clostridium saccharoperbutylacetonicum]NRT59552.1 putative phosphoesterase [Clostridium saccharoperbutylacetonicum]NSB28744.1 putative phosphoesterase [Clostridium saccharoperbutylacetonicum]NSB34250.1 putative phosphoesterase [Clostridium saccharoperbutylacetonicum]